MTFVESPDWKTIGEGDVCVLSSALRLSGITSLHQKTLSTLMLGLLVRCRIPTRDCRPGPFTIVHDTKLILPKISEQLASLAIAESLDPY